MIADSNKMKRVLKEVSGYRIAKDTGISQSTVSRWITGETEIEDMKFKHAVKLTEYCDKIHASDSE